MFDEVPSGSSDASNAPDGPGGGPGESESLQARAQFLKNWHWESVVGINRKLCQRDQAQHGANSETHAACAEEWLTGAPVSRSIFETLDWLRSFHRKAPFLFFNGNTFAEIARTLTDGFFAEFPHARRRAASSLAAHYVAGVLERDGLLSGLMSLAESTVFEPGDAVKTLKGSTRGVVVRVLSDGRIAWKPEGSGVELRALPEALVRLRKS